MGPCPYWEIKRHTFEHLTKISQNQEELGMENKISFINIAFQLIKIESTKLV